MSEPGLDVEQRVLEALASRGLTGAREVHTNATATHRGVIATLRFLVIVVYVVLLAVYGVGGVMGELEVQEEARLLDAAYASFPDNLHGGKEVPSWYESARTGHTTRFVGVKLQIAVALALLIVSIRSVRRFGRRIELQACRPLDPAKAPRLAALVAELQREMKIERPITYLLATLGRGLAPSVHVGATIQLVVPPRLVVLASREPAIVRAMIAHELAHVIQRDDGLWLLTVALATSIRRVMLPFLWFGALGGGTLLVVAVLAEASPVRVGAPIELWLVGGISLAAPLVVGALIRWVTRTRLKSEVLADLSAMLYGDPAGLRAAASRLIDLGAGDPWHEPPDRRRLRAEAFLGVLSGP